MYCRCMIENITVKLHIKVPFGLPLKVKDKVYGLKEYTVLGIRILYLFRLVRFLSFVHNRVQGLTQSSSHHCIS